MEAAASVANNKQAKTRCSTVSPILELLPLARFTHKLSYHF